MVNLKQACHRILLLLFATLLLLANMFAQQLNTSFTTDKHGGCAPALIQFTNTSSGASANAIYKWDLGNGNTSALANPSATYDQEKDYTVSLTVTDGGQTSTATRTITVYKRPTVAFTVASNKFCLPDAASFQSQSTAESGSSAATRCLQQRIFDAYMQQDDQWWQAFHATPTTMVNNWNPWCNFNVLTCFLLLEKDKNTLAKAVHRTMVSVDKFLNYNHADGACEEGPSYWGHAAGKMYDYLQLLSYATGSKISIFDHPMVKNMGEYIVHSYVGKGWVVNFADASAKSGTSGAGVIYRYGKATQSDVMMQFASYLQQKEKSTIPVINRDLFRLLESMRFDKEISGLPALVPNVPYVWYPQTEFCYMRSSDGFFFAGKGGYNAESHNHNDAGTFVLYYNSIPFFIDAGVGTYTRQTFSNERYSIWTMQSDYHNLPIINGHAQSFGRQYKARYTNFEADKMRFFTDIAEAYPADAGVKKWERSYVLQTGKGLVIEDNFEMNNVANPHAIHFLTWARPDVSKPGEVRLEKDGVLLGMNYDTRLFAAVVDEVALDDKRLSGVWGSQVYRLRLVAKSKAPKGRYSYHIKKL